MADDDSSALDCENGEASRSESEALEAHEVPSLLVTTDRTPTVSSIFIKPTAFPVRRIHLPIHQCIHQLLSVVSMRDAFDESYCTTYSQRLNVCLSSSWHVVSIKNYRFCRLGCATLHETVHGLVKPHRTICTKTTQTQRRHALRTFTHSMLIWANIVRL